MFYNSDNIKHIKGLNLYFALKNFVSSLSLEQPPSGGFSSPVFYESIKMIY